MPFKMHCPKCGGLDYNVTRDNLRSPSVDETFSLVFACRCGKQLFGEALVQEHDRQRRVYEADEEARVKESAEREAREREERERVEAAERAAAYRRDYLLRKRQEAEDRERREREERDREWKERVAAEEQRHRRSPESASASAPEHAPSEEEDESFYDDFDISDKDPALCHWPPCQNPHRPNSKYCSRACSNKNARSRYRKRRRDPNDPEPEGTEPHEG